MSYQTPAFMVDQPFTAITDVATDVYAAPNTAAISDAVKRAFIDRRMGSIGTWSASGSGSGSGVRFDLGGVPSPLPNRLVIPAGHDLDGYTIGVYHASDSGFTTDVVAQAAQAVSGSDVIDLSWTAAGNRYFAVQIVGADPAGSWSVSQLSLGERLEISDSPVPPGFESGWVEDVSESAYPGGTLASQNAPARRRFSLPIRWIDPASADWTTIADVLRTGRHRPFWFWPPESEEPGPFHVKLDRAAMREQSFPEPSARTRYDVTLEMTEQRA